MEQTGGNKNKITEMMERRNVERKENLATVVHARQRDADRTENVDYFLRTFGDQTDAITKQIATIGVDGDRSTLAERFDVVAKQLQTLQNYLSTSTLFLPDSVVKRHQSAVAELTATLEQAKQKLIPKKRFGFKAKQPPTATTAPSSVAVAVKEKATAAIIDWTIQNRNGEEILLEHDAVNGKDLTMSNLSNCLVRIVGHPGSLQLSNITDCLVLCGPVARSVFVDNCTGTSSRLVFGCQQFRLHSSTDCDIYMHVTCRAIIEDCTRISVAPYTFKYDDMDLDFAKAALDLDKNNWTDVADFNWLSADKVSPNWRQLAENERIVDWSKEMDDFRRVHLNCSSDCVH